MDFVKHYITQCIALAANNLRLNNQQIEVIALLKESIQKSSDLGEDIINMKKVTELSRIAIRFNEIFVYLNQSPVDLLKISEQYKEHSRYLLKDLGNLLDISTPVSFKSAIAKLHTIKNGSSKEIKVDLSKRKGVGDDFAGTETERIKEKIILDENESEDELLQNFEENILRPVKLVDSALKRISNDDFDYQELLNLSKIMDDNSKLSRKIGFEIIANMHSIISRSLNLIRIKKIMPGAEIIEGIRACLIVIVAVVRGKEVDITNYLNKAEALGRSISNLN